MKTILHLTSSIYGDGGQSSRLAGEFVAQFPEARVIRRDLGKDVEFVYAEGLAISEASKAQSLAAARNALRPSRNPKQSQPRKDRHDHA